MMSRDTIWTFGPMLFVVMFFVLSSLFVSTETNLDLALLFEQAILVIAVLAMVFFARHRSLINWRLSKNWSWLYLAGPLWLAILTPIAPAIPTLLEKPQQVFLWVAISLLVAINEETVFRGFLFGGLQKWVSPIWAAVISSALFGLLHVLNGLFGADAGFLVAQMIAAFGTGMIMAVITWKSGSIWPAIFLHFATDAVGITYLGGYANVVTSSEAIPGLIIMGFLSVLWASFWFWRQIRAQNTP